MGLKCSLLGHAYEPAEVDREREERGSEVVTVSREIERCQRCGAERVVSESTEVTTVVDEDDVDLGREGARDAPDDTVEPDADWSAAPEGVGASGDETTADEPPEASASPPGVADRAESADEADPPPDPAEEDAEILTDDPDPDRQPGQWPEEAEADRTDEGATADAGSDAGGSDGEPDADRVEPEPERRDTDENSLAGITVPEGSIACPDCGFRVDAESPYRDGDLCPECGGWLTAERNP